MIARLKGIVEFKDQETCVVDVAGVGYELSCSLETLDEAALGETAVFEVYTHVREDQISLFGFRSRAEKEFFLSLLSVNGIGPKMAIKILSAGSLASIARAIEGGDAKALSQLPKVGKKTAEQLVVSLKGKMGVYLEFAGSGAVSGKSRQAGANMPLASQNPIESEITSALTHLGFRSQEIEHVLTKLGDQTRERGEAPTLEEGVRFALQFLAR